MSTSPSPVNRERLLGTFLSLLTIDSPSGDEAAAGQFVAERLRHLDLIPQIDAVGNVLARTTGEGEPLLLSAHLDVVPPCRGVKPVVEGDLVRSDGTTVLGADDKSGVAAILEALAVLHDQGMPHPPLELAFTVQEELGHGGAKALDRTWFQSKEGIVVDLGDPLDLLVTRAPGQNHINATILGRSAHAGFRPEQGINAIFVAAEAIANMNIGRIDAETTANVGTIGGGQARNIVPARCQFLAEARSHNPARLDQQTKHMVAAIHQAAARHQTRAEVETIYSYNPFAVDTGAPIVQRLLAAGSAVGLELRPGATGGGSDANEFNRYGITSVVVGTGYADPHTNNERIAVSDLVKATHLLVKAVTLTGFKGCAQ